jgi:hypothetical protein
MARTKYQRGGSTAKKKIVVGKKKATTTKRKTTTKTTTTKTSNPSGIKVKRKVNPTASVKSAIRIKRKTR